MVGEHIIHDFRHCLIDCRGTQIIGYRFPFRIIRRNEKTIKEALHSNIKIQELVGQTVFKLLQKKQQHYN